MCGLQTDEDFLNAIVVRKRAVLSQGGQRLNAAARWCRRSSKPECVSLFPIRGLSLSSRHWQHREKRKNSPSGIHLPSLFCLGTLRPPSLPFIYTHIHTHIFGHTRSYPNTYCCHDCMQMDNMSSWTKMRTHRDKTHKTHSSISTYTQTHNTHKYSAHTHLQMHDE